MSNDAEPRFSGMPSTPAPEVFEQARRNNPEWFRLIERAYEQFAGLPENAGIYADPKGGGATIEQIWLVHHALRHRTVLPSCTPAARCLDKAHLAARELQGDADHRGTQDDPGGQRGSQRTARLP